MARILVAEDDDDLRWLLELALTTAGHTVLAVPDGVAAARTWAAEDVDLVVLDADTPGLDGDDLVRAVRADRDRGHVPVIVLTGRGEHAVDPEARRLLDAVVSKPFRIKRLAGLVDKLQGARLVASR